MYLISKFEILTMLSLLNKGNKSLSFTVFRWIWFNHWVFHKPVKTVIAVDITMYTMAENPYLAHHRHWSIYKKIIEHGVFLKCFFAGWTVVNLYLIVGIIWQFLTQKKFNTDIISVKGLAVGFKSIIKSHSSRSEKEENCF